MRIIDGALLFSASDLVNFLGCPQATKLDLRQLIAPVPLPPDDAQAVLLQEKGIMHERAYLARLRGEGRTVCEVPDKGSLTERVGWTRAAMAEGPDVIYQGALHCGPWHGFSDFLLKSPGVESRLGSYAYDIADTKLALTAKPKHVLQLSVYAELLKAEQGLSPPRLHVVLGDGSIFTVKTEDVRHYGAVARSRFERFAAATHRLCVPEPCGQCSFSGGTPNARSNGTRPSISAWWRASAADREQSCATPASIRFARWRRQSRALLTCRRQPSSGCGPRRGCS